MRDVGLLGLVIVGAAGCAVGGGDTAAGGGDTAAASTCTEDFPVGDLCACAVSFDWTALGVEPASVMAYVVDLSRDDAVATVCEEALTQGEVLDLWSWPEHLGAPASESFDLAGHEGRTLVLTAADESGAPLGQRAFSISSATTSTVAAL